MRTSGIFSSLTKVTIVQADDRGTDSLEAEAVELFAQLSKKESSLHVPVFAFSYTAGVRAPALSFVVSLRMVFCLIGSVMFCPFFHGDFRLFWNTFCSQ